MPRSCRYDTGIAEGNMFRLAGIETSEQEIKKSRFIAIAGPVADEHAAWAFISAHSDATANHNCWAWRP
jgi:putative IMPACT (imprinted ancient) family translation regulator